MAERQKPSLGSPGVPPGNPPTRGRPQIGLRPDISEVRPPSPFLLLRELIERFGTQKPSRVEGGPMFDAVSALMAQSPQAAGRVSKVMLRPLDEGVLGQIEGTNEVVIDPAQSHLMFEGSPMERLLQILRHETAHVSGYDEDEALSIAGGEGTPKRRKLQ